MLLVCLFAPAATSARPLAEDGAVALEERAVDRPPLAAPQSLGFRLVGIVVADDAAVNLAIIEYKDAPVQGVYREGGRARGVLIKRILSNEVIVDTGRGNRRLRLRTGLAPGGARVSPYPAPGQAVRGASTGDRPVRGRRQTVHLSYAEAASELGDVDRVLREVELSSVRRFGRPAGVRISHTPPGGILSRLGLRDGDIIKRLDQWEITSPDQAAEFLQRISEGGRLTLAVNKRRRTRHILLNIE